MMYDHFGTGAGLMARIKIVMLVILFVFMAVAVNLKFYRGIQLSELVVGLVVCGGFLLAIVIGIVWHAKTGHSES